MTLLAHGELASVRLDAVGHVVPSTLWRFVSSAARPVAVVCPVCWPSYQNDAGPHGSPHLDRRVVSRPADQLSAGSVYTCTVCRTTSHNRRGDQL